MGYSMCKRAAEAREDGRFPKTDFKKENDMPQQTLDALVEAGIIDNSEWHHTSKYGNRNNYYSVRTLTQKSKIYIPTIRSCLNF